jgi:tetratricopeptide (TPR) repeat protein/tRNA A-37 threonylcarbamoyl transferase component Bud32
MPCPAENSLNRYVHGRSGAAEKAELESHFEKCPLCQELVRDFFAWPLVDPGESESISHSDDAAVLAAHLADQLNPMAPGKKVGRYRVLELVGKGAMGEVYAAYDPQLDRRVALKVLHSDATEMAPGASRPAQARLLREARAMARVTHPNVIAVHDVQSFGGEIAIAMEFISGCTLRQWVNKERRPWQKVLNIFVQAGKGLAAAHKAGLVHRDFKPENVLVGNDGRVLVTDFGLVRSSGPGELDRNGPAGSATSAESTETASSLSTKTGSLLGTPAYMAPEQFSGLGVDSRADQYSFCVALWEALYGERPFQVENLDDVNSGVFEGRVAPPAKASNVPTWVKACAKRGLSPRPADRFASMEDLLSAIRTDRTFRQRRTLRAALVILAVVIGAVVYGYRTQGDPACPTPEAMLEGTWDPETKAAVVSAIAADEQKGSAETARVVERHINEYVSSWRTSWRQHCIEVNPRTELQKLLFLEEACLIYARDALTTLTAAIRTKAHDGGTEMFAPAVLELPHIARCEDRDALAADPLAFVSPSSVPKLRALRSQLAQAETLRQLALFERARPLINNIISEAERSGLVPLLAESLCLLGSLEERVGNYEPARALLRRAGRLAGASGHVDVFVEAHARLLHLQVFGFGRVQRENAATAANDASLIAELHISTPVKSTYVNILGTLALARGELVEAANLFDRAAELARTTFGAKHPRALFAVHNRGMALTMMGHLEEARTSFETARASYAEAFGREHPVNAWVLGYLGRVLALQGELPRALAFVLEAVEIMKRQHGIAHPGVAAQLNNLGFVRSASGDYHQAVEAYTAALQIMDARSEESSETAVGSHIGLGTAHLKTGRHALARVSFSRAMRLLTPRSPYAQQRFAMARFGLARSSPSGDTSANELAKTALRYYRELDYPSASKSAIEIETWLRGRRSRRADQRLAPPSPPNPNTKRTSEEN